MIFSFLILAKIVNVLFYLSLEPFKTKSSFFLFLNNIFAQSYNESYDFNQA